KGAEIVRLEHRLRELERHVLDRPAPTDPRIVDEDVDAARACDHLLNPWSHRTLVVDVERQRRDLQVLVLDGCGELGGGGDVTNARMALVSEPREVTRGSEADAAAASRDQHNGHGHPPTLGAARAGRPTRDAAILCDLPGAATLQPPD